MFDLAGDLSFPYVKVLPLNLIEVFLVIGYKTKTKVTKESR